MAANLALKEGREAYARRAWSDAYARLSVAAAEAPLAPDDLERLAVVAFLCGHDAESVDAWTRAYQHFQNDGNVDRAVLSAVRLVSMLAHRNQFAQMQAWLARAERLLEDHDHDCVIRGYPLIPRAIMLFGEGELAEALDTFVRASEIGRRFGDRELIAFADGGRGRLLIAMGHPAEGFRLLDEVMVDVTAGEVSPMVIGHSYCSLVEACFEAFDLRRAQEWTEVVRRWCEANPDIVAYRGDCILYHAEILQMRGSWKDALDESRLACQRLSDPPGQGALAHGHYRRADLHRVRGEYPEAEDAYREAVRLGRPGEPGIALLRLAHGEVDRAAAMMRRALAESARTPDRARLLPAHVEIMLAAGDLAAARDGADELAQVASLLGAPLLKAQTEHARGALRIAEGRPADGLAALRNACVLWHDLDAPYELARTRVKIGIACRMLGDEDAAALEFDAASWAFGELGAQPDVAHVEALKAPPRPTGTPGLTERECDVLRLVAAGLTNRAIADHLVISEKTVARHLANIFAKLGISSRAAATAWAYEHSLLKPSA